MFQSFPLLLSSVISCPEYQDYLSRCGEDNELYYDVKINASKLLLEHIDDTFVTPVFNGSTSLRDAAGQMIENVTKAVKRKQEINEAYFEKLFSDMTSLYRLNLDGSQSGTVAGKAELGKLPQTAVILLSTLVVAWALMLFYVVSSRIKSKKLKNKIK